MNDFLSPGMFTLFDALVGVLLVISGLMAFARGFIRELTSIAAFALAILAAIYANIYLSPMVADFLPDSWSPLIASALVMVLAFLVVYIVAAWFGASFSKLIHINGDIGLIDRLVGFVFGVARGIAIIILVLLATRPFIEDAEISWIKDSYTYPYFEEAVIWVQNNFGAFAEEVKDVLPEEPSESP